MRAIDNAVVEGMKAYLKTCSNGGMPQNQIDLILEHVNAAARSYARGEINADNLVATGDAAWAAACAATRSELRTTVWYAARAAMRAATRSELRTTVWYAARDATRAATRDAAWDPRSLVRVDQERIFVEWLDKMESADELE